MRRCRAGAIHYHVRDADGGHILDAGLYHEAIAELQRAPEMHLQMTTETIGKYHRGYALTLSGRWSRRGHPLAFGKIP